MRSAFGFGGGKIFLSEDNAKSWPHSAEFAEADHITWSCLMKNGNILFATRERLFLSTDNLKTHREIVVKNGVACGVVLTSGETIEADAVVE